MKSSRHRKNQRERFALPRVMRPLSRCPNCGEIGQHYAPPSFGDRGFYLCEEVTKHVRIPVTVETESGQQIEGHITGDPDMPPKLRAALAEMMRIAANQAIRETDPAA